MSDELRQELAALTASVGQHLRRARELGQLWVPAGTASSGVIAPVDDSAADNSPAEEAAGPRVPGMALAQVRDVLGDCKRCRLHSGRRNLVFGVGSPDAEVMFVGEAPGRDEDAQGEPFVGKAGQLLTRMIGAMGLRREEVYIANIIKCRPPNNRNPEPDEVASCEPFLRQQIDAIAPRILIALGNFAAKTLLNTDQGITRLRGSFHRYQGVPLMPTFHPAYLLRNPDAKRAAWSDLQAVMAEMDRLGLQRRRDPASR